MRCLGIVVAGGIALYCAAAFSSDGVESQGRAILDKHQKAVVTVQLVIKVKLSMMGMGGEENESKEEATGFVIDPSGLVVLSLSETDPGSLSENVMSGMPGEMADRFKIESNVSDVKVLLDDGTEIPGQIVLRDKDLDLAFVRPLQPLAQPLPSIDLSQSSEVQALDQLVALNRLGKVAGRVCSVNLERVQAVVRRPRTFYVPGMDPTHSGLGSPAFTMEGKIVGIIALRAIRGEGGKGMMGLIGGGMQENMMAIVVPASDIQEVAKQAPMEAPKEPPKEAPTEAPKEAPAGESVEIPAQPAQPAPATP
jgi:S1-C subfamily serine protease